MATELQLKLREGDAAPGFTAQTNGGGNVSLADFKGRNVILYFYPKDDTPGCTKEACAFRDQIADFQAKGAVVLGVSTDPVKAHDKFVEKFKLPFTLLADVEKSTAKAYGVLNSKGGFDYARRDTFVIDPTGKIAKHYENVDPEKNVGQVLEDLAQLGATPAH